MTEELTDLFILMSAEAKNENEEDKERTEFDKIIGHIEDVLMEDEFQSIQQQFLDKYWSMFEPIEENKLEYMEVFTEYNKVIESYIDNNLKRILPNFSMDEFVNELHKRKSELEGEVFEVLLTFTDFLAFKELLLDYRAVQEGKVHDLSSGIVVKSFNANN